MASTSKCGLPLIATDRIKKELREMVTDPKPGIYVAADEHNFRIQHALIVGPEGTPYEGGFFYFTVDYINEYPSKPPKVRFMTTANHSVRLNPNLYADGTVCMSILNTWKGNPWSPALTLSTLLISIQTLLNEEPYHNEPGFEKSALHPSEAGEVEIYNNFVQHETIRIAVCDMLEDNNFDTRRLPEELRETMEKLFAENADKYLEIVKKKLHLDGSKMKDKFDGKSATFDFNELLERLKKLKNIYQKRSSK